jgi:hypothetical protein
MFMLRRHSQNINMFKISTFRVFSKSQDDRYLVENGMSTLILTAIKKGQCQAASSSIFVGKEHIYLDLFFMK